MNALIRRLLGLPAPRPHPKPAEPTIRGEDDPLTRSRRTETNMQAVQAKIERYLRQHETGNPVADMVTGAYRPPRRTKGTPR